MTKREDNLNVRDDLREAVVTQDAIPESDWAWLAGFLDARGMITLSHDRARLYIRHGDFAVMEKIADMIDVNVRGPFRDTVDDEKKGNAFWVIQLSAYNKLSALYDHTLPYLSEDRAKEFAYVLERGKLKRPPKRTEFTLDNCGFYPIPIASEGGYRRHLRQGEEPCRVCMESSRLYDQRSRARLA